MSQGNPFSSELLVRVLAILATIALLAMPFLARKLIERFTPADFATAVIAQNREAFKRLAEM
jgi:Tfp pilus assembly protein FimT